MWMMGDSCLVIAAEGVVADLLLLPLRAGARFFGAALEGTVASGWIAVSTGAAAALTEESFLAFACGTLACT